VYRERLQALTDLRRSQLRLEMFDAFVCKEIKAELDQVKRDLLELSNAFE
jgi:hypothetical protein